MQIPQEIFGHLEDYADGALTPEGREAVEAWCHASEENSRQLAEWFVRQAELRDAERLSDAREIFSAGRPDGRLVSQTPRGLGSIGHWPWLAVAASLLLVIGAGVWEARSLLGFGRARDAVELNVAQNANNLSEGALATAAYVGRSTNCVWSGPTYRDGAAIAAGDRLDLESGRAEFVFGSGARVTAMGPCQLAIDDESAFSLLVGDVSVEASFGFKVDTPSGVVIDLGTAFGVSVDDEGGSEVHVFEGEVAFQPTQAGRSPPKSIVLSKDQACRYSVAGVTLDQFQANEAKFAWRQREPLRSSDVPSLPIRSDLVLWLAADRFVETDHDGRVECWRDLVFDENNHAEDALQPAVEYRPLLTPEGINGHPSVRFGGEGSFLLTPPLYTTNEQTAFIVCSLNAASPGFQQMLNYNGPPQRKVGPHGGSISPAVFQVFLDDGDRDSEYSIKGHLFSGFADGRLKPIVTEVSADNRVAVGQPVVVCFRHSLDEGEMELYVNGSPVASKASNNHIAITSRKIIGRHPIFDSREGVFDGDIGEVLIYNDALPASEVLEISSYLCERFGITD